MDAAVNPGKSILGIHKKGGQTRSWGGEPRLPRIVGKGAQHRQTRRQQGKETHQIKLSPGAPFSDVADILRPDAQASNRTRVCLFFSFMPINATAGMHVANTIHPPICGHRRLQTNLPEKIAPLPSLIALVVTLRDRKQ